MKEPETGHPSGVAPLALAALGVVFGDIGTSPLYSMQTVFSVEHNLVEVNSLDVLGVVSIVFWSVAIIVAVKYLGLVMRADNEGEGGILALAALLREKLGNGSRFAGIGLILAMVGASLFYGDSVLTPAVSVMSAIEGLSVVNPAFEEVVVWLSVLVLTGLFVIQRFGTSMVGRAFGPIMALWFVTIGAIGVPHIIRNPGILKALSPTYALAFAAERPFIAFIALGAIVLAITGAEALYADMGHFGPRPIRLAWFWVVFPCLVLNYFGQGAMILADPSTIRNPFFLMAPEWATLPLVILAMLATIIASQAVISGAYSVSYQAMSLGLLPRLLVKRTSKKESGQIYIPGINWVLFAGVLVLITAFQSSAKLATAYGLAVTGTLLLETTLFLILARTVWHWVWWKVALVIVIIGGLELAFSAPTSPNYSPAVGCPS